MTVEVPNGIYDNAQTMVREVWNGGRLIRYYTAEWLSYRMKAEAREPGAAAWWLGPLTTEQMPPFFHFPQPPAVLLKP